MAAMAAAGGSCSLRRALLLLLVGRGSLWRAYYHWRPLRRQLGGVYLPDPSNPRTPEWQLRPSHRPKLYGRHGEASGVDPTSLWPRPQELAQLQEEEQQLCPSLADMRSALHAQHHHLQARQRQREELIAAQMAKMPQMIADWRREKEERKTQEHEEKKRRERLLAEVRERLGYNMDHRSPQFQEMVQEMEKARRKELKLQKKEARVQAALAKKAEKAAAAAASQTPEEENAEITPPSQAM